MWPPRLTQQVECVCLCEITSGRQSFINYHKKNILDYLSLEDAEETPSLPLNSGFLTWVWGGVCWWIGAVGWGKKITWVELWRVTAPSWLFLPRPAWGSSPYSVPWLRERDLGAGRPVELAIHIKPMSITLNHRGTGGMLDGGHQVQCDRDTNQLGRCHKACKCL